MVYFHMMDLFVILWTLCVFILQISLTKADITVKYQNYTYGPFSDKEGEFGYSYMGTFQGSLYVANPRNGCGPIEKAGASINSQLFVLIDDGGCSYYTKLLNARDVGYSIAIVRSLDSDSLKTMKGSRIDILGLYVGKYTGDVLAEYNHTTGATISIHVEFNINFEIYLIPLVIIIGICFILMILFLAVKYWRTRIQERRSRLTPANLKKIPTKKYKEGDEYDLCAICLDDYKVGEKLRILPCNHGSSFHKKGPALAKALSPNVFHIVLGTTSISWPWNAGCTDRQAWPSKAYHCKCVDPWLTNGKKTCPVCKQAVEKDDSKKRDDATGHTDATERTPLLNDNLPSTSHQAMEDTSTAELV